MFCHPAPRNRAALATSLSATESSFERRSDWRRSAACSARVLTTSRTGTGASCDAGKLSVLSMRAVRRGRPAAGKMNGREVLSRYAQVGHDIQVDRSTGEWIEALVEDK